MRKWYEGDPLEAELAGGALVRSFQTGGAKVEISEAEIARLQKIASMSQTVITHLKQRGFGEHMVSVGTDDAANSTHCLSPLSS